MRSRFDADLDSHSPLIMFLGDDRDDEDHDILFSALRERDVAVIRVHPLDLVVRLDDKGPAFTIHGRPLRPDLVVGWVLDELLWAGMTQLDVLSRAGIPVINDAMTLFRSENKLLDSSQLCTSGLLRRPVISGYDHAALATEFADTLGPTVIKPLHGYGGRGIERLDTVADWDAFLKEDATVDSAYYAMPWVENPGRDIRVYTVNHHAVFAMYRYAPRGGWITNVKAGGQIAMCPVTEDLADLAARASRSANTLIGGVDIGEDVKTGEYIVYEVNSCPTCEPPVLEMVADFLVASAADYEGARSSWRPRRVYSILDQTRSFSIRASGTSSD